MRLLHVHDLCKSFAGKPTVSNISIDVDAGEIVGILGPNGAGKSTTFGMIAGLLNCDSGKIVFDGVDLSNASISDRVAAGISYFTQDPSVFLNLSVSKNIMASVEMMPKLSAQQRRDKVADILEQHNLTAIADHKGQSLSGGERRRVEMARALVLEPKLMLLDEPFAGVDPVTVTDLRGKIRAIANSGMGVLITDHNVRETLSMCHRAYIVSTGTVLISGSPDEIMADEKVIETYLGKDFNL